MNKIFVLGIICCLGGAVRAQETSSSGGAGLWDANHFLWFTGHWSKVGNKRTFVIDKGKSSPAGALAGPGGTPPSGPPDPDDPPGNPSAGGTITFNPNGSVSLENDNVDDWNKKMDKALDDEQKYLRGLQDPGTNLDPTTYHLHQLLLPDAQQRVQEIQGYKIDPSSNMLSGGDKSSPPASVRSIQDVVADGCKQMKPDYDEVMNYYNTQVKGHKNDLKYPMPPGVNYDCYSCDSNLRIQYDSVMWDYIRNFSKEEAAVAKKGFSILHDLALAGINENSGYTEAGFGDLFRKNKQDPSKSGACAFMDIGALSDACKAIVYHAYRRAEKMLYDNRNNYSAAPAIIRTFLSVYRDWLLLSGEKEDESILPLLADLINKDAQHYVEELRKNDWRQIANIPLMLSMIRDAALVGGGNSSASDQFYANVENIVNGFRLKIDMDVKIGVNNGYKLAHLKGECHIIPSFQQDRNQCYKWVIADEGRQEYGIDGHGFYMAKAQQTFDATLVATQIVAPGPMPTYTGTKKYIVQLAGLSMDFCHPGNDTIDLSGFTANPPDAGTWLWPNGTVTNEGEIGMEQYFEDISAKKKFVDNGEAKKAKDDLRSQAEQLRVQMEALKAQMTAGKPGASPGANYEKMMEFKQQALSKVAAPVIAKLVFLNFLIPVRNNDPVLVHAEFDAKKINPQEQKVIIYGYYRIDIENDANGKPQQKPQPKK